MGATMKGSIPLLVDNLSSSNDQLKLASLQALGQLAPHSESAADSMQNCLADRKNTVREAARASLEKIHRATQAVVGH
jgi:vesicle coat complex subunit